jgi:hypothetical protein
VRFGAQEERHSSSGVIVVTGTGATGWARSICGQLGKPPALPGPSEPSLAFLVREPFPSVSTGTQVASGLIEPGNDLELVSEMNDDGVLFGDGIEDDRVLFQWGMRVQLRPAEVKLRLVLGA